jgi:hypothetical protein
MDYFYNSEVLYGRINKSDLKNNEVILIISELLNTIEKYYNGEINKIYFENKKNLQSILKIILINYLNKNYQSSSAIKIVQNYVLSGNYYGIELLASIMTIESILGISAKQDIFVIEERLLSHCSLNFRKEYPYRSKDIL